MTTRAHGARDASAGQAAARAALAMQQRLQALRALRAMQVIQGMAAIRSMQAVSGYAAMGNGDNYWAGRFGAGNCNADNTQGYVYIPGTGSVTYRF